MRRETAGGDRLDLRLRRSESGEILHGVRCEKAGGAAAVPV